MNGFEHLDESTRETAAQAERLALAARSEPDAGFEARVAGASLRALAEAGARTSEPKVVVSRWRWGVALKAAAAMALVGVGWLVVRGAMSGGSTSEHTDLLTEADWSLVFEDSEAAAILDDADRLSATIENWNPDDPLGVEEAM